jgi:MoaA/NifB/PqqE/SkfB family radical SAM enzyme
MPWTGLMYNFDGTVKNCIRSSAPIGNIQEKSIEQIINNNTNIHTRSEMIANRPGPNCNPCYELEKTKNKFDIISDRVFYLKELKQVPMSTYEQTQNFDLHTIDVRWTNLCNFACVYCGPEFSSKWASELNEQLQVPTDQAKENFKSFVLSRTKNLKHVYLAGGEPLLMKENLELLEKLYIENPEVNLRINTNLSKVDTSVFDQVCKFKNVHWTISVETIDKEYEYIRYGGSWTDFVDNLAVVKSLNHKITFNMLYFLLNYSSIFDCIEYLQQMGFHNNSFVIGALIGPAFFDVRHLPGSVLNDVAKELEIRISQSPKFLLENSYQNLLQYIKKPMNKDLKNSFTMIKNIDKRRNLNSKDIFPKLYAYE